MMHPWSGLAWVAALRIATCAPGTGVARPGTAGAGAEEVVLTLEVAARRVACQGEAPQRCLRVRTSSDTAWRLFYDPIAGFTHEEGYRSRIDVARRTVRDPPADGSGFAYRLVRVRERTRDDGG